jgi:hypothetical protein
MTAPVRVIGSCIQPVVDIASQDVLSNARRGSSGAGLRA